MLKVKRGFVLSALILLASFLGCVTEDQKISPIEPEKLIKTENTNLTLKFKVGSSAVYKSVIEKDRSVSFEGKIADSGQLKGGHTGRKVEIVFSEFIDSVDANGVATAKITIDSIRVFSQEKDKILVDFDSSRAEDKNNKLAKIVGESYRIKLNPAGEVLAVSETAKLVAMFKGTDVVDQGGSVIFSNDEIKQRHSIVGFKSAGGRSLSVGDIWSDEQNFSFGMIGEHNYEKIYTLKSIEGTGENTEALISMEAIPAAEKEGKQIDLSKMFDSEDNYNGEIHFNVAKNRVTSYYEKLNSNVIIVDPTFQGEGKPDVIRMSVLRYYSLEKID